MAGNNFQAEWRSVKLPFGEWHYLTRHALNIVRLNANATNCQWRPVQVSLAITSQCHKNCDFCYASSNPQGTSNFNLAEILNIVEIFDANNVFGITLGGGEPLLWHDAATGANFYDLLVALANCKCDVSFTTAAFTTIDWAKIPQRIVPRLSLHHLTELPQMLAELNRASEQWRRIPAINILFRSNEVNSTLQAAEQLAQAGVKDVLILPLRPAGRASRMDTIPEAQEVQELVTRFPIPQVKISACYAIPECHTTYLGCGAGDWFIHLDGTNSLKSCSFSQEAISLEQLDYQTILELLQSVPRLPCHQRIVVEARTC